MVWHRSLYRDSGHFGPIFAHELTRQLMRSRVFSSPGNSAVLISANRSLVNSDSDSCRQHASRTRPYPLQDWSMAVKERAECSQCVLFVFRKRNSNERIAKQIGNIAVQFHLKLTRKLPCAYQLFSHQSHRNDA